jgi:hypothetical protein
MTFPSLVKIGLPATRTLLGQVQVPPNVGTQGCGVKTPNAAAVADATIGLLRDVHMPQGVILTMPPASAILATGLPATRTVGWLVGLIWPGAVPIVHAQVAPATTK